MVSIGMLQFPIFSTVFNVTLETTHLFRTNQAQDYPYQVAYIDIYVDIYVAFTRGI